MTDELDGYRTNPMLLGRRLADDAADNSVLFRAMYLGDVALRAMQGTATAEDTRTLIAQMIADCEIEAKECLERIVKETDLTTDLVRDLHFRAHVCAQIIGRINQFVRDGHTAAMQLAEETK